MSVHDERWQRGFDALQRFLDRTGHSRVPVRHVEDGFPLGQWVAYHRRRNRRGKLARERAVLLASLPGWAWGPLPPGPEPKEDRNEALRQMRSRGASLRTLSEAFDLSPQRCHQLVRDIPARSAS